VPRTIVSREVVAGDGAAAFDVATGAAAEPCPAASPDLSPLEQPRTSADRTAVVAAMDVVRMESLPRI
jgi:hypothetical protein